MKASFPRILFFSHVLYVILLYTNNISCVIFPRSNGPPEKYCGPKLSGALDTLCLEYSLPAPDSKRSNSIGNQYLSSKRDGLFVNRRYALSSFFRRTARKDPYLVFAHNECCEKGCTMAELLQYCQIPKYSIP